MPTHVASQSAVSDLRPGQEGEIISVSGPAEIRHRLLEMGLTPGTRIELIRVAPLGDPVEIRVRGYRLSLRKSEASAVQIDAV